MNARLTADDSLKLAGVPAQLRQSWLDRLQAARSVDPFQIKKNEEACVIVIYDPASCISIEWCYQADQPYVYLFADWPTDRDVTPQGWLEVFFDIFTHLGIESWLFGEAWWEDKAKPGTAGGQSLWLRRGEEIAFWTSLHD